MLTVHCFVPRTLSLWNPLTLHVAAAVRRVAGRKLGLLSAVQVMTEFDHVIVDVVENRFRARAQFKGHLDSYRFLDNVWTFIVSDATFRLSPTGSQMASRTPELHVHKLKMICLDNKVLKDS